jgi:hypothetical protein
MMSQKRRELYLHPFLFALFPILTLLAANLGEMDLSVFLRPALVGLLLALTLILVLRLITKNWRLATILTSFLLLVFFA